MQINHDAFAALSPLQRPKVWQQLTPENQYEIVAAQWRGFLDTNRDRLSFEQIQFLETSLAELSPDDYRRPRSRERIDRWHGAEEQFQRLFPAEQMRQLHFELFIHGGEISNPIARALVRSRPKIDESTVEELMRGLKALATLAPEELRKAHPDLAEIVGTALDDLPSGEEFWSLVDHEDVPVAASRAYWFLRSKRIRNPIVLSLRKQKTGLETAQLEKLKTALQDVAALPPADLRSRRYGDDDLPAMLGRGFDDMPSGDDFWKAVDDEDVRIFANNMRIRIELQLSGELPPPGRPR